VTGSPGRRWLTGIAAAVLASLAPAGVAFADPPGPTDFHTEVVSVEPPAPQIEVDIIGGDSFVRLVAAPGTTVQIPGYSGEPYVQNLADGTVQQNRRSPAVAANNSRYGVPAPQDNVGTAADQAATLPEWVTIGNDGTFVWHDHRAHLMVSTPPAGYQRGDVVSDQTLRLTVDGAPVDVRFVSVWQERPSRVPVVAGALVAGFGALILLSMHKRMAWLLAVAAAAATGIGYWQYASVPPATGPSTMWFLLPAVAAGSAVIGLSFGRTLISHALVLLGGLELGVWVYLRRDGLARALLPTDAPFWLDRAVTSAAGVAAVVAVIAGGVALFQLPGAAQPEPLISRSRTGSTVTTWGRQKRT
jgi:hypothetical protein